jgi:ribonuclease P protein subunit RPR2
MAHRDRRKKPQSWLRTTKERMDILFDEAKKSASDKPKRANRYVKMARKLGMRYNVRIPRKHRREFCHKCDVYLLPGKNCTVRTNSKTRCVEYTCHDCKSVNRYGYHKENRSKIKR